VSPPDLDPLDLIDLDHLLSDEEKQIRGVAREWIQRRVLPEVEDWFEKGEFPARELAKELGELGFFLMQLDTEWTLGLNSIAYGLVELELEAGDSGLRSFVSVQSALAGYAIYRWGSEEQKAEWLPKMASGEAIACFGLSEPDSGSDPGSMRTSAKKDGDDWILNGTKMWITNGGVSDIAVVWAQTDDGIRGFVVPCDVPGFAANPIHKKLSLRASDTSELVMDGVRLPADAAFPEVRGLKGPLSCLNEARYGIVWGVMGAARSCLETAIEYSKTREQFDRPIGSFQLTQKKLADMALELYKGTLLAYHLGRLKDEKGVRPEQVSVGKLNNTREALKIARTSRAILGANGITLEYPIMRHMTNLESVLTYEGTEEVHTLVVGEQLTGLKAFT
jgi:glutaryl-CoA dehydrogenase